MFDVFVKVDSDGRIINITSSMYIDDTTGWVLIDSGAGDKYQLAGGNYFPRPIRNIMGVPVFKLVDGHPVERGKEEILADMQALPKSQFDTRLEFLEKRLSVITELLAKMGIK